MTSSSGSPVRIRAAGEPDLPFLTGLINHYVETSTCVYHEQPFGLEARRRWLAERGAEHPVLIAELDGQPAGYGALGPFRPFAGYRHTVEHSVYVRPELHRRGVGRAILGELVGRAAGLGHHALVGVISADQEASLALHRALGFREVGRLPEAGRKFGRWLDVVLVQRMLGPP